MADEIHDFIATGHQMNPSKKLIILKITGAWSDISEEIIKLSFLKCTHEFFRLLLHDHFLCFLLALFFVQNAVQNMGMYYTRMHLIHG